MAESKEEVKSLLIRVKEESEEADLKLNIQKTKIMASGPIPSWQIDGDTMETVTDFIFLDSKISADSNCSHEINRCLLRGRKVTTNLDNVSKKQRYHFTSKGPYSQSYGFSSSHVRMWELDHKEGWVKNGCFLSAVLENTLETSLNSKEIKPSIPQEINPEYSLEGLMLKLKLQYFGHLMKTSTLWKRPWCWEIKDRRRSRWQMMKWLDGIINSTDMSLSSMIQWKTGKPGMLRFMGSQRVGHDWVIELNWTDL